jgi:hypothetical protein
VTRSNRRLPAVAALGAALAVGLLGACSAGQIAQTSQIVSAVPGAQGTVEVAGPTQAIALRNVTLDYPGAGGYQKGATAPLAVWIVNGTESTVTLSKVTSDAGPVTISSGGNSGSPCSTPRSLPPVAPSELPTSRVPSTGQASPSASGQSPSTQSPSTQSSSTQSPSAPASPAASPSPSGAGSADIRVTIPAGGCVELDRHSAQFLQIARLADKVDNGSAVPVEFTFTDQAGQPHSTTLDVPVDVAASPASH